MALSDADRQRLVAAQRVLRHAVTTPRALADIEEAQAEAYASLDVDPRDGEALKGADTRRIHVYRGLVRSTMRGALRGQVERAMERLGEEAFERYVTMFIETELPVSRVLRDVPYEFVRWATPLWREDDAVAPWIGDHARWELLEFDVYTAQRHAGVAADTEPAADKGIAFDGTARLARFDYAVHLLPDREGVDEVPKAEKVAMLCYRDEDRELRRMDLTPIAYSLLELLMFDGAALAPAVQQACAANDHAIDQKVIDGTSKVLEDLANRGVVLGVRDVGTPPIASPYARWLTGTSMSS